MFDRLLLIRPVPLTCFVSICKRYVRTPPPPANAPTSTPASSTPTEEQKSVIDASGRVFTFKHGYVTLPCTYRQSL